ncbi:MAG TPA: hypothetical protein VF065_11105, partial [Ilumatobacter sp.]
MGAEVTGALVTGELVAGGPVAGALVASTVIAGVELAWAVDGPAVGSGVAPVVDGGEDVVGAAELVTEACEDSAGTAVSSSEEPQVSIARRTAIAAPTRSTTMTTINGPRSLCSFSIVVSSGLTVLLGTRGDQSDDDVELDAAAELVDSDLAPSEDDGV